MVPHSLIPIILLLLPFLTEASQIPDPFAYPAYRLSFLNHLPISNETAERWLKEGVAEEKQFLELKDTLTIENGQQERHHQLLTDPVEGRAEAGSSIISPEGEISGQLNGINPASQYQLQHLLLPPLRSYLCLHPPSPAKSSRPPPPPPADPPMDPALPGQLLEHLGGNCLYLTQGWFTYQYCHHPPPGIRKDAVGAILPKGPYVRQFRALPHHLPHSPGGWIPKEDPEYESYILGTASPSEHSITLGRGSGSRYLVSRLSGGTVCDKSGSEREIEVQFHCSLTGTDSISLVKEVRTCVYILVVNTPRLCSVPGFSAAYAAEPPHVIHCREILPFGETPPPLLPDSPSPTTDGTPLPSWAMIEPPKPKKRHLPPKAVVGDLGNIVRGIGKGKHASGDGDISAETTPESTPKSPMTKLLLKSILDQLGIDPDNVVAHTLNGDIIDDAEDAEIGDESEGFAPQGEGKQFVFVKYANGEEEIEIQMDDMDALGNNADIEKVLMGMLNEFNDLHQLNLEQGQEDVVEVGEGDHMRDEL